MEKSIVLLLIAAVIAVRAQAQNYATDYNQLREQHQKAIQAAIDPLNRRYAEALDSLLRKATQAGDLNTAVQLKEELSRYAPTGSGSSPSALGAAGAAASNAAVVSPVLLGKWRSHTEDMVDDVLEFRPDGTVFQVSNKKQGRWRVDKEVLVITVGSQSQRYPLPLDPKTNKGKTDTNRGIRITKIEL